MNPKRRRVVIPDDPLPVASSIPDSAPVAAEVVREAVRPIRARRAASSKDHARLARIEELRGSGRSLPDATWRVLGEDEQFGYTRFRGTARPGDATLRSKYAALLARVCPESVERARLAALAAFSSSADDAARRVATLSRGEMTDAHKARVQLDASRTVLEAVGIGPRSTTAVQVNTTLSLGDGLRALRRMSGDVPRDDGS